MPRQNASAPPDVCHDFLLGNLAAYSDALLQPLRKILPGVPLHYLDGLASGGVAQTDKGEIQLQRLDHHVGELGGNGGRFSSHPHLRYARKRQEIPDRCT
jgi:hypothetical protein